jgi:hypothetical protein
MKTSVVAVLALGWLLAILMVSALYGLVMTVLNAPEPLIVAGGLGIGLVGGVRLTHWLRTKLDT